MVKNGWVIGMCIVTAACCGCVSNSPKLLSSKPPTIAHAHIGHSIEAWRETPNKKGLLGTAEAEGKAALESAKRAAAPGNDLSATRDAVKDFLYATDPTSVGRRDVGLGFGLTRAVEGVVNHLEFAADSDDASANVKQSVPRISDRAELIVDRCDQMQRLAESALAASSQDKSNALAQEILALAKINQYGDGADYGLAQLRADISAMIKRESPSFTTVDTWYLLNLIRLPSGKWDYADSGGSDGYKVSDY
jgi:hypothetical protein